MKSSEIREKFLKFFEDHGHTIIPSASLLPEGDNNALFSVAGMQQFKPYFSGVKNPLTDIHPNIMKPLGNVNVASIQKCLRTIDIDLVGDNRHLTMFEMVGNFSFGGYFKKEMIPLGLEFVTKVLNIPQDKLKISIFEGDSNVPFDQESYDIWSSLGIKEDQFIKGNREDNFWGPVGSEGPCGPCTEVYVGDLEIWNLVFIEFNMNPDKTLTPLKQKGVDTGGGLERMVLATEHPDFPSQNLTSYDTDLFIPLIEYINSNSKNFNETYFRIIADHFKSAVFLIADGLTPSNTDKGYVLRRLIRRVINYQRKVDLKENFEPDLIKIIQGVYANFYPEINNTDFILDIYMKEKNKFLDTLEKGLRELNKTFEKTKDTLDGKTAFYLYESFGFPLEMIIEEAKELNISVNVEEFKQEFEKHKDISRAGAEQKFGGHGLHNESNSDSDLIKTKLHTATHLLLQALREKFGNEIVQKGSDINEERLRLDFPFERKLTEEELKEIEDIVNSKIQANLEISCLNMPLTQAQDQGYLGVFMAKYPDEVSVYSIGDWSKEICAGPHVKNTKELGIFKILKEESSSAGIRRIKAKLE